MNIPHSPDAEAGILGSIFHSPQIFDDVQAVVADEHFFLPRHKIFWNVVQTLVKDAKPIDLVTVTEQLAKQGDIEAAGGFSTPQELFRLVGTSANWKHYADILNQKKIRRDIIQMGLKYSELAQEESENVAVDLLDQWQTEVVQLSSSQGRKDSFRHVREGVEMALDEMANAAKHAGRPKGVGTGFSTLDMMTGGMLPGQMIVIAARPSMGKTALAMNIAEHVAVVEKKAVGVFSLEMSYEQITARLLCSNGRVSLQRFRDGSFNDSEFPRLAVASSRICQSPLYIDETAAISIAQFRSAARQMQKKHGVELFVIDYLQLMRSGSKRGMDNRQLEIAEISAAIKQTAKDLGVPIIVLSQLNRDVEKRKGNRPAMSDLRESGAVENDADVIGLLFREEYYADKSQDVPEEIKGKAELIIAKQRNGPTGSLNLQFIGELTRFQDWQRD
jgi:replicative DNA helicase